jgi:hydrogenase maturation protease
MCNFKFSICNFQFTLGSIGVSHSRCLVAGLGNSLMGDDGIGPAVVARLARIGYPPGLRAAEIGSDVSRLPTVWNGEPDIWLVDAVEVSGGPPGSVHRIEHDHLLGLNGRQSDAHQLDLFEQLQWLRHGDPAFASIQFTLWGAVPESIRTRPALSDTAAAAADRLATEIVAAWNDRLRSNLIR